jgi:hypothetical protein
MWRALSAIPHGSPAQSAPLVPGVNTQNFHERHVVTIPPSCPDAAYRNRWQNCVGDRMLPFLNIYLLPSAVVFFPHRSARAMLVSLCLRVSGSLKTLSASRQLNLYGLC